MNDNQPNNKETQVIRSALSKIEFPEICPVCLEKAEDLVAITITERSRSSKTPDDSVISSWRRRDQGTEIALASIQGAATFWVPTCMAHGSRSVRTEKKRFISWLSFFILFYPILYFILGIVASIHYNRPLQEPLTGLAGTLILFFILIGYGYLPRSLERALKFIDIDRGKDYVFLEIRNAEYQELFLNMNEMHTDLINKDNVEHVID